MAHVSGDLTIDQNECRRIIIAANVHPFIYWSKPTAVRRIHKGIVTPLGEWINTKEYFVMNIRGIQNVLCYIVPQRFMDCYAGGSVRMWRKEFTMRFLLICWGFKCNDNTISIITILQAMLKFVERRHLVWIALQHKDIFPLTSVLEHFIDLLFDMAFISNISIHLHILWGHLG